MTQIIVLGALSGLFAGFYWNAAEKYNAGSKIRKCGMFAGMFAANFVWCAVILFLAVTEGT